MSMQDFRSGVDGLREVFEGFNHATSGEAPLLGPRPLSLLDLLVSRVGRAIGEGMPILESECSRRMLAMPVREDQWSGASLVRALELDLEREENPLLRWLVISHWVTLCTFDAITANVEPLMASNPDEVIWLVAAALWVQWASGQPTAHALREALTRFRTRNSDLDVRLATIAAGPPSPAREAAEIAQRLLADPSATLLTCGVTADKKSASS